MSEKNKKTEATVSEAREAAQDALDREWAKLVKHVEVDGPAAAAILVSVALSAGISKTPIEALQTLPDDSVRLLIVAGVTALSEAGMRINVRLDDERSSESSP